MVVEIDREDQNRSNNDLLHGRVKAHKDHAGLQRLHDEGAQDSTIDRAHTTGEAGAADHRRGDDVQLVERPKGVGGRAKTGRGDDRGKACQKAHQRENLDRHPAGVDAGELGCFRIATDGKDIAAKAGPVHQDGHADTNTEKDQNRDSETMRDEEAALGDLDVVFCGIGPDDAAGPIVGIHQKDRTYDHATAECRQEIFGPDRALRKAEGLAFAAAGNDHIDHGRAADQADDPAARRTNRAIGAAAKKREGRVNRRDRFAARHEKRRAAPDQKATERDDEGRDREIGNQPAMQRANHGTHGHSEDHRDDPDRRMTKAKVLRQDMHLHHPHGDCTEAKDRTDGEIDVSGDNHQNHARRHDADRGRLDRKVPEVAGGQESAEAGFEKAEEMKADPDHRQRGDHAKKPGIKLCGVQETADRIFTTFGALAR